MRQSGTDFSHACEHPGTRELRHLGIFGGRDTVRFTLQDLVVKRNSSYVSVYSRDENIYLQYYSMEIDDESNLFRTIDSFRTCAQTIYTLEGMTVDSCPCNPAIASQNSISNYTE